MTRLQFREPQAVARPFRYTTYRSIFEQEAAVQLAEWFERGAPWRREVGRFYDQFEFNFVDANLPPELRWMTEDSTLAAVRSTMQAALGASFLKPMKLTAHKLIEGQGIGIHNDNAEGEETHRLIVPLSREWDDSSGGHLLLFRGGAREDLDRAVRPLFNTGFAFSLRAESYHAVATVNKGERYTLIFSFWEDLGKRVPWRSDWERTRFVGKPVNA